MKPGALMAKPLHVSESSSETDSPEVCGVGAPVDSSGVPVPPLLVQDIQVVDPVVSPSHDPIVGNHRAGDARQKNAVGAEIVAKRGRRLVQQPRVPAVSLVGSATYIARPITAQT